LKQNACRVLGAMSLFSMLSSARAPMLAIEWLTPAAQLIGYCGAAAIVLAYFLNQRGRLASDDWRYPAINLAGSASLLLSLSFQPNPPSVVIELFWLAISLYGLQRNLRPGRRRSQDR
jgi:hypothetical protein